MDAPKKRDLRVEKTLRAIRSTFETMLLEMPYPKITVRDLCDRAQINKKTFYHHYPKLDSLLDELVMGYAQPFINLTAEMRYPQDLQKITYEFLLYSSRQGELYDSIMSNDVHATIRSRIIAEMEKKRYVQSIPPKGVSAAEWNIYMTSVTSAQFQVYRQWVLDGRIVPFGRMVEIACALINNPEILTDRYAMNISEPSGSVPCVISFLNDNSAFPEIARAK